MSIDLPVCAVKPGTHQEQVYVTADNGIISLKPERKLIPTPEPITTAPVLVGDRLYFACRSHLCSYEVR